MTDKRTAAKFIWSKTRNDKTVTFRIHTHVSTEKANRGRSRPTAPQARFRCAYSVTKLTELVFAYSEGGLCVVRKSSDNG